MARAMRPTLSAAYPILSKPPRAFGRKRSLGDASSAAPCSEGRHSVRRSGCTALVGRSQSSARAAPSVAVAPASSTEVRSLGCRARWRWPRTSSSCTASMPPPRMPSTSRVATAATRSTSSCRTASRTTAARVGGTASTVSPTCTSRRACAAPASVIPGHTTPRRRRRRRRRQSHRRHRWLLGVFCSAPSSHRSPSSHCHRRTEDPCRRRRCLRRLRHLHRPRRPQRRCRGS